MKTKIPLIYPTVRTATRKLAARAVGIRNLWPGVPAEPSQEHLAPSAHNARPWVISVFAGVGSGPYYNCIGVSETNDPVSGGWFLYALPNDPSNALPDYSKFACGIIPSRAVPIS